MWMWTWWTLLPPKIKRRLIALICLTSFSSGQILLKTQAAVASATVIGQEGYAHLNELASSAFLDSIKCAVCPIVSCHKFRIKLSVKCLTKRLHCLLQVGFLFFYYLVLFFFDEFIAVNFSLFVLFFNL